MIVVAALAVLAAAADPPKAPAPPAPTAPTAPPPTAPPPTTTTTTTTTTTGPPWTIDFHDDVAGQDPQAVVPMVGNWLVDKDGDGNVCLKVDGTRWKEGVAGANLADKAKALYGARYAEFLDNVTTFSYFPYAVLKDVPGFQRGSVTLRFKSLAGRIDQAAGIAFNIKETGDYLVVRANPLEDNLVLFQFVHGKRSPLKWVKGTPTSSAAWHTLKLDVDGKKVHATLDDKHTLDWELKAPVDGKVGVWSKADSVVLFDDVTVVPKQ